ncbi:MAG TPA: hypothetical protein VFX85_02320, partial [Solirubrobacterales bacterium]|nr:hypothetical protein [Solirubrobacterales bacterium]
MRSKVLRGCVGAFAALAMFVVPAAAQAASHPFLRVAASGTKTPLVPFETACGTAVGPDSRLLVSDYDQNVINAFVTALAPLAPLPSQLVVNESSPLEAPSLDSSACALAIDSGSNVYAASYHQGVLRYPAPSYLSPTTIGAGQATGVAVDRATDALYVTRPTHVDVYGAPVTPASVPSAIGTGSLTSAYGVAISGFPGTQGFVYVADAADDTVKVFDPATDIVNPIATIDGAGTPQGGFRDLTDTSLAIDDSSGQLFVLDNLQPGAEHPAAAVYAFDASGAYLGLLPKALVHGEPSGVAVDNSANPTQGLIYVTSGNEAYFNSRTSKNETPVVYAFCPTAPISSSLQKACPVPSPATSIEVSRAGSGRGTVVGAGAEVICGDLCATEADVGTVVTLVATPKPHSTFGGWSVSGGTSSCGAAATCKVTLSSAAEVTATFAAIPQRQLTVSKDGSGSGAVTSSPVG